MIAGYRRHTRLNPEESDRLSGAIAAFGIVLDCWSLLFHDVPAKEIARSVRNRLAWSERAATRAVEAFDRDEDELTAWFVPERHTVDPDQGELF